MPSGDARPLTGDEIESEGLVGWRYVHDRLAVRFEARSFSAGATFVQHIAETTDESGPQPDIDLRQQHVTVALRSQDDNTITAHHVRMARRISELADRLDLTSADHAPDVIELALDTPDHTRVKPFYGALLGYIPVDHEPVDLRDPEGRSPSVWFQLTDSGTSDRQRWHLCVKVPHDDVEARVQAVLDAGGRLADKSQAPEVWVVEDPDGNRSCLCTWQEPATSA